MCQCDVMRTCSRVATEIIRIKMLINTGEYALLQIKYPAQLSVCNASKGLIQCFIFLYAATRDEP